ncbi:MAG: hypothetical protein QQM50_06635 [Dehalococcoides mccartyi]|uniref:hypothetical protein n=1 Tax=Dehalococcoides TaxID=61434 RepID=UPI002737E168|nr:hypothetical protein [Dehalococcoides mccartyi]MDP4280205.1 hypothetical protein [Dehalococcoides mccartyi]
MNDMVFQITGQGKDHVVEYKAGIDNGEVSVDGNVIDSKGSSVMGVLMKKSFKIGDNLAKVRRRDLLSEEWDLVYGGKIYTPSKSP